MGIDKLGPARQTEQQDKMLCTPHTHTQNEFVSRLVVNLLGG